MDRRRFLEQGLVVSGAVAGGAIRRPGRSARSLDRPRGPSRAVAPGRERLRFDSGWRFAFGHAQDPARDFGFGLGDEIKQAGAVRLSSDFPGFGFDDSGWRVVDLPHDWAVELPFENHEAKRFQGSKPVGWPFPATSVGWYRRTFTVADVDRGRRLTVAFDGIYRDSIVTLNGYLLGRHLSGYTGQEYDISDYVSFGGKNIVAVRVDATQSEGWYYEGAGIYRHAWLTKTHPIHVVPQGTVIRSAVEPGRAVISVGTEVANESDQEAAARVTTTILDPGGASVGSSGARAAPIPGWEHRTLDQRVVIDRPALWSPESPQLYEAVIVVEVDGVQVDRFETRFGIKTMAFHPQRGFLLNDQPYALRGTNNHQDFAGVGVAVPDAIHRYRIERLKSMGSNAYRAHHPSTAEFLDACDEMGMLVLAETRAGWSTPQALEQLEWMVRRDRNHACVLAWSLGNQEVYGGTERGDRILASMRQSVRALDPVHAVTFAQTVNPQTRDYSYSDPTVLDVQGLQYPKAEQSDEFHRRFPTMPVLGTEVASTVSTRGIYVEEKVNAHVSTFEAYEKNRPGWGSTPGRWMSAFADRPYLAGAFVWAGFDYRGEPNPYQWPAVSSHYGVFDTCGFPKDHYWFYRAWWTNEPVLHLFPHWNWSGKEGQELDVYCYTNLDRVELLHNGKSRGSQDVARFAHLVWKVPYAPGVLEARGYRKGRRVMVARRETTGEPAAIQLSTHRPRVAADGEDVALVEFRVVDASNRVVPTADNEVTFALAGPGRIIGVANGNPSSHEPDKSVRRKAFNGLGLAIIQATTEPGELVLSAQSPGLASAAITVSAGPATPRPRVP